MAFMSDSFVHGLFGVKDGYSISENQYHLASIENDDTLNIGDMGLNTETDGINITLNATNKTDIVSQEKVTIESVNNNVSIKNDNYLDIDTKRIRLRPKSEMYGTADPNDLDLHDVEEGTLYFKLVND